MAEAEYWRFTVARDCQKKNTSETHSECSLRRCNSRLLSPLSILIVNDDGAPPPVDRVAANSAAGGQRHGGPRGRMAVLLEPDVLRRGRGLDGGQLPRDPRLHLTGSLHRELDKSSTVLPHPGQIQYNFGFLVLQL